MRTRIFVAFVFLLGAALTHAKTINLTSGQGPYQAIIDAGCQPGWFSNVVTQSELSWKDIQRRRLDEGTELVLPANCAAKPPAAVAELTDLMLSRLAVGPTDGQVEVKELETKVRILQDEFRLGARGTEIALGRLKVAEADNKILQAQLTAAKNSKVRAMVSTGLATFLATVAIAFYLHRRSMGQFKQGHVVLKPNIRYFWELENGREYRNRSFVLAGIRDDEGTYQGTYHCKSCPEKAAFINEKNLLKHTTSKHLPTPGSETHLLQGNWVLYEAIGDRRPKRIAPEKYRSGLISQASQGSQAS